MKTESINELSNRLGLIAMIKDLLPRPLRGRVNALGLYVHGTIYEQRQPDQSWRIQAGGMLQTYFEAWAQTKGGWQIKKFDSITWQNRFAHVIEPTYEIAEFIHSRIADVGELDRESADILTETIKNYKATGNWSGLPNVNEATKSVILSLADMWGWNR